MKAADIKAAAYWKQTGAVLGKTTYKRPNEVRKIIECINLEDRDMAFKIQGLLKKGEDGGNLGTAEQEWIARIVSTPGTKGQTPPEVVFYDSAVKVETPEFGTAWAAMRPIMDRAYRYRDNYHDKAIRPLERF